MRLGAYETLVDLGRGGMADLYVGRPTTADALVILKTLRPPVTEKRIEMFLDEARLGLLFDHPNVVRTFSVGEESGRHFIAMELLDGQPLDRVIHRLRAKNRDDEDTRTILLWILAESLAGLHYAHELAADGTPLHIVHRDFTPHNLFVTYDGHVKTLDFGIAKAAGRITRTTTGEVKGKVRYMAPEQALGLRTDRRADVFAAGAILFEICNGAPFWRNGMPDRDVFDELIGGAYPVRVDSASATLNAILTKSLARDASERYRNADEMRSDLLAEVARRDDAGDLGTKAAALLCDLFADQRDRTKKMVAHAEATKAAEPVRPSPRPPASSGTEVDRASAIKQLLTRLGLALFIAGISLGFTREAHAAEAQAEEHFKRGLQLFDEGDFKLALVEFERSYEIAPNFRVLYNIGEVQLQLSRYANARRTLTQYLEAAGERISPSRRADVEKEIESLAIRTALLHVKVDVEGAEILVDGERAKDGELVDAGAHRIVVQKPGFIATNDAVTLVGGDDKTLNIHLAAVPPPPKVERPVVEVRESNGLGPVWIGWGLTVAFGVATVGTVVAWQNADGKLTDLKGAQSSATERTSQARSVDTLRTLTFVAAGATLVTAGVSLFLTLRRGGDHASPARVSVGPGSVSFSSTF